MRRHVICPRPLTTAVLCCLRAVDGCFATPVSAAFRSSLTAVQLKINPGGCRFWS